MRALAGQCTCAPLDWNGKYWLHEPCAACDAGGEEQSKLIRTLCLSPWQDVTDPDAPCPYPSGSQAAQTFEQSRDPRAEAIWRALAAAACLQK